MPDYRRYRVAGGTYFFTVNLLERKNDLLVRHVDVLRDAVRGVREDRRLRQGEAESQPNDIPTRPLFGFDVISVASLHCSLVFSLRRFRR